MTYSRKNQFAKIVLAGLLGIILLTANACTGSRSKSQGEPQPLASGTGVLPAPQIGKTNAEPDIDHLLSDYVTAVRLAAQTARGEQEATAEVEKAEAQEELVSSNYSQTIDAYRRLSHAAALAAPSLRNRTYEAADAAEKRHNAAGKQLDTAVTARDKAREILAGVTATRKAADDDASDSKQSYAPYSCTELAGKVHEPECAPSIEVEQALIRRIRLQADGDKELLLLCDRYDAALVNFNTQKIAKDAAATKFDTYIRELNNANSHFGHAFQDALLHPEQRQALSNQLQADALASERFSKLAEQSEVPLAASKKAYATAAQKYRAAFWAAVLACDVQ